MTTHRPDLSLPLAAPEGGAAGPAVELPKNVTAQTVLSVHHWTDRLFSFTVSRDPTFRFDSGQFVMIGLLVDGKPLLRAYSVASAHYEEHMEFLSIKVPDGPLTSRLKNIQVGDTLLVGRKATGTLLLSHMLPGRNLYFLSTGTGLAPFMSLIRDPDVYDNYEKLVLVHGCRQVDELAYRDFITEELPKNDFLGEQVAAKLIYYPTVTREEFVNRGRVTELIETGKLFTDIGLPEFDPELDRVMICGSEDMLAELVEMLKARGWLEGHNHKPGQYVIEKAFAEK